MRFDLAFRLFMALLGVCFGASAVHALFSAKSGMPHFTQSTFKSEVMATEQTTLVLYYAPWCGYCKQFSPAYEAARKKLKGYAKVGAINCDEERQLCADAGVQGFPVVKAYYTNPKTRKRVAVEYQGDRSTKSVTDFALDRLPNFVKPLRAGTGGMALDKFYALENATLPKLVVVKPPAKARKATAKLLKALAIDYHYRVVFGEVTGAAADDAVYADFGVAPKDTAVFVIPAAGAGDMVKYDGEIKQKPLRAFLDAHAAKEPVGNKRASKAGKGSASSSKTKTKSKSKTAAAASTATATETSAKPSPTATATKKPKIKAPAHDEL
ncbi:hypothetical protein H9P43_007458 [Blastocladiella emersonii ATCC 22665]|nr:hypothetical protein H9P43_007458 [Blastocladiella emersonii ATCC 22665]